MNEHTNPLQNIKIASPCPANWNQMIGDSRKRFCAECRLNVYNLSGMTRAEAENLLLNSEGRLCVRFYRRADGTVLMKDCPVGWRALKRRISKTATAFASLFFGLFGGLGLTAFFNQPENEHLTGAIKVNELNINANASYREEPGATMGDVAVPFSHEKYTLSNGGMSNLEEVRQEIGRTRR